MCTNTCYGLTFTSVQQNCSQATHVAIVRHRVSLFSVCRCAWCWKETHCCCPSHQGTSSWGHGLWYICNLCIVQCVCVCCTVLQHCVHISSLGPSHLPLETATRHLPVLRQPRPLQMQRHPSAQEQGEFNFTNVYFSPVWQSLPFYVTIYIVQLREECLVRLNRVCIECRQSNQIVGIGVCG